MKEPGSRRRFTLSLSGLMEAAACLAIAGTVLGFFGRMAWWADLFSHFRVQYAFGLLVLGTPLLFLGRKIWGSICLGMCVLNLMFILPLLFGSGVDSEYGNTVRVLLINVNSATGDPERVMDLIKEEVPDLLILQEITSRWANELADLEDRYPHRTVRTREDNFGIGLYSRYPLSDKKIRSIGISGVPSVLAKVERNGTTIEVIATHPLPPYGKDYSLQRNDQLATLPSEIDASTPTILVGDLNTTPWSYTFRDLLKETGLRNSMKGFGTQPTWPIPNLLFGIPLDHILHSDHFQVFDRRLGPDVGSDHSPVIVDLIFGPTE